MWFPLKWIDSYRFFAKNTQGMKFLLGTKPYLEPMPTSKFLWLFKILNMYSLIRLHFWKWLKRYHIEYFVSVITELEMSVWWKLHQWLHMKLLVWQLSVQPLMKISSKWQHFHFGVTVYPKKYAHGFCFAVICCGYTLTDFPISIRLTSLALWQSNDCPSASKATLMNMDKYFMWIHYERLHNHNKAKHNKTVCIFLGIYCSWLVTLGPVIHHSAKFHTVPTYILELPPLWSGD